MVLQFLQLLDPCFDCYFGISVEVAWTALRGGFRSKAGNRQNFHWSYGKTGSVIVLLIINWWGRGSLGRTCHIITWAQMDVRRVGGFSFFFSVFTQRESIAPIFERYRPRLWAGDQLFLVYVVIISSFMQMSGEYLDQNTRVSCPVSPDSVIHNFPLFERFPVGNSLRIMSVLTDFSRMFRLYVQASARRESGNRPPFFPTRHS